jgi:hypothetical protein
MLESTFTFQGHHMRLDQIKSIEPLRKNTRNLNGWTSIFMKDHKLDMRSQYEFAVWFVGKNGGYREFYSKTVDYIGLGNFKGDVEFETKYQELVHAWRLYHDQKMNHGNDK